MFTRGNPLQRYLHANGSGRLPEEAGAPYALVTGSTGGMGEEWAYQLAALGFNIIIQGRNRTKLEAVAKEIHSRPESKHVDVKLLVTEATIWPNPALFKQLDALMADDSIRLTVLINNLGINTEHYPPLETQTREEVAEIIIANSMFPTEVTRTALPKLKKHQPSVAVTISSMAFQNPPPFLSPYCGTKGFDVSFCRALSNEMAVGNQQVDVVCMVPGHVISGMLDTDPSFMVPTSKDWVISGIESLRSTWLYPRPHYLIHPWRWQRYAQALTNWLPGFVSDRTAIYMAITAREKYEGQLAKKQATSKL